MTEARYHELLGQMLDSRLSESEAEEMRHGVAEEPRRLRDLREHLMLWDLWAQEQEPHRSPEAFRRGFLARLRTEIEGQHAADSPPVSAAAGPERRGNGRWVILGCAAGIMLALTVAILRTRPAQGPGIDGPAPPARLVSLHGEAVCTRCILHQTDHCQLAIRVREQGGEELLVVNSDGAGGALGHRFCRAPVPVLAEGTVRTENGRQLLLATRLEAER